MTQTPSVPFRLEYRGTSPVLRVVLTGMMRLEGPDLVLEFGARTMDTDFDTTESGIVSTRLQVEGVASAVVVRRWLRKAQLVIEMRKLAALEDIPHFRSARCAFQLEKHDVERAEELRELEDRIADLALKRFTEGDAT